MCVCLLFYGVGKRYSVAVSLERSYYYVAESSGLVNINIVTSDRYDKDFTVKLSVILGRHQTRGDYGKQKCVCVCVCFGNKYSSYTCIALNFIRYQY